jgi:metal-responsive CopG/Arc/MetJ family transcriptional regulator
MKRDRTSVKKYPVGLKIDPDLLLQVDLLAEQEGRSRSVMISRLVKEGLEARELVKESEGGARVPA